MGVMLFVAICLGIAVFVAWKFNYKETPIEHLEEMEPVIPDLEKPELPKNPMQTETGQQLYAKSKSLLGVELTPGDEIPDIVACVANLQEVYRRTTGSYIGSGSALYSTKALKDYLLKDTSRFTRVFEHLPGDILVYATGEGNGQISNGHCFIPGVKDWMSNNSYTGLWSADFTEEKARAFYEKKGGFTPYFFRPK